MSIVLEGWIEKCGPKICPTWNKRWLVLYDTKVLEYFVSNNKQELKGIIELFGDEQVIIQNSVFGPNYENGFELQTNQRTYKFAVKTALLRQQWCKHIRNVLSGNFTKNNTLRANKQFKLKRTSSIMNKAELRQLKLANHHNGQRKPRSHSQPLSPKEAKAIKRDDVKWSDVNMDNKFINLGDLILHNIIEYIYVYPNEFGKYFILSRKTREVCITSSVFFNNYTLCVYPKHCLNSFGNGMTYKRDKTCSWMLNHDTREILIFGNIKTYKYTNNKTSKLIVFNNIKSLKLTKLFIDDPILWDTTLHEIQDLMLYIQQNINSQMVTDCHIRCYEQDNKWCKTIPMLSNINSLNLDFTFDKYLFAKKRINCNNLIYLKLHRIDLIDIIYDDDYDISNTNDEQTKTSNINLSLRASFKQLKKLLVLDIEDCRWQKKIELPVQLKFFRFKPSDHSTIDMSKLIDYDPTMYDYNFKLNYPLDLIVYNNKWPSVINKQLIKSHEVLGSKRLRIWVLKHNKPWDKVLMNVNYCNKPPPLNLFKKSKCFKILLSLDKQRDMSDIWTSKNTKLYKYKL